VVTLVQQVQLVLLVQLDRQTHLLFLVQQPAQLDQALP
jgi:hypothetical protein